MKFLGGGVGAFCTGIVPDSVWQRYPEDGKIVVRWHSGGDEYRADMDSATGSVLETSVSRNGHEWVAVKTTAAMQHKARWLRFK